jgi:hypothetical protein
MIDKKKRFEMKKIEFSNILKKTEDDTKISRIKVSIEQSDQAKTVD